MTETYEHGDWRVRRSPKTGNWEYQLIDAAIPDSWRTPAKTSLVATLLDERHPKPQTITLPSGETLTADGDDWLYDGGTVVRITNLHHALDMVRDLGGCDE